MATKFDRPLAMGGATTTTYHPNQVPPPALPPTPPGSAGHSPPPLPYLHEGATPRSTTSQFQSPAFSTGATPNLSMSTSSGVMAHDGPGPSRRHHYDMPETPQGGRFPNEIKGERTDYIGAGAGASGAGDANMASSTPDSPYRYHGSNGSADYTYSQYRARSGRRGNLGDAGWEGTLSAAIASTIASVRAAWASADPSTPNHALLDGSASGVGGSAASTPFLALVRWVATVSSGISMSSIRFGLLCALWYSMSALSSNTGKVILNRFRYPVTLTFVQFGFVAGWCAVFIAFREGVIGGKFAAAGGIGAVAGGGWGGAASLLGIKRPNRTALFEMFIMSLFQIAGHVFSSMAIARVPVSTVHTIKALSPLFTVIAYAGLFGVRYSTTTYMSLLPLTLGVMLACSFELRANGVGLLCALGSTIVFVSQNIFGKKLLPKDDAAKSSSGGAAAAAGGPKMDKLSLLFYSSGMAYLLMIPIWLWSDGGSLFASWFSPSYGAGGRQAASGSGTGGAFRLMFYFLCNGSVHFAQCILAFSILARTSPVTYSIASLIKRIAVICLAIVWFGQKTSPIQAFGMCMTFGGLWMYNRAKGDVDRGERKRGQVERKADLLLPTSKDDARLLDGFSDSSRAVSPMPLFAGAAYSKGIAAASPRPPGAANGFASYPASLAPSHAPPPPLPPHHLHHLPHHPHHTADAAFAGPPSSASSSGLAPPASGASTLTTSPKSLDRQLGTSPPPSSTHQPLGAVARSIVSSPPSSAPINHPAMTGPTALSSAALAGSVAAAAERGSPADGATSGAQARTVADGSSTLPKRRGPSISLERGQPIIGLVR